MSHMTAKQMAPMRMNELARRARLPKSTVAYYVRMGLLSEPIKTGKTMAYYDETHLDQLRAIRKLRRANVPLVFIEDRMARTHPKRTHTQASQRRRSSRSRAALAEVRQPRRHLDPAGRRQQIVEAASRIFLEKGFDQTSVADVTDSLRIGRSTFYLYFRDKRGLFLECIDNMFNSIFTSEMWEEIRQEDDALKRLLKRAEITLRVSPRFFEILQLLRSHSHREDVQLEAKAREIYARVVEPVKRDLERGMRQGILRQADPELLSYVLLGALESLWLRLSQEGGHAQEEALGILTDFMDRGLLRQAGETAG